MREPRQDDFEKHGEAQLRHMMARLLADLKEVPAPDHILELAHQLQSLIDAKTRILRDDDQ